ncbi:MAG: lipoyl(octanoyl) transferase LipB [Chloroflexota bacterium]|nr:lipoyl(octanoyl) transferase LipB [Chloroflexota bacterium]
MRRPVWLLELGVVPFDPVHDLQRKLVGWRRQGLIGDVLLLLEHTPVITLGRRADESNILVSRDVLQDEGIEVCRIERGGDVTYHGPGQLVGYPIVDMHSYGLGASDYMHRLEAVIRDALATFGVETRLREKIIGVWVGENKIAALGVRIKRGVTFHGFALNVAPNMAHWSFIIPCGITDGGVTSLAQELDAVPSMAQVRQRVAVSFAERFGVELVPMTLQEIEEGVPRAELTMRRF